MQLALTFTISNGKSIIYIFSTYITFHVAENANALMIIGSSGVIFFSNDDRPTTKGNEILDVNGMTLTKCDDSPTSNANCLICGHRGIAVYHDNIQCGKGLH